ncbi:hypothetical protein ACFWXO_05085 [Kitasatospora sp. NPDC059088]|uniref:hypothetical protein n=1 Tax=Kitasatospora sp. NPDC059088 TaxID=3346722 RepID=UPI0036AC914A
MIPPDPETEDHPSTDHLGRRVYGSDWNDDSGPEPARAYRNLRGGHLDGLLLDVGGWSEDRISGGAYLIVPRPRGPAGGLRAAPRRPGALGLPRTDRVLIQVDRHLAGHGPGPGISDTMAGQTSRGGN